MSERIDHAAEAVRLIELSSVPPYTDESRTLLAAAQVHATLALVEQQRIANLIALSQVQDGLCASAYSALAVMSPDRRRTILDPNIAAALRIGDSDE